MAGLSLAALPAVTLALQRTCLLGLGWRMAPVADVAALRAVASRSSSGGPGYNFHDDTLAYVGAQPTGQVYRWETASTATDDGAAVIAPTDAGATGRWLRMTSVIRWPKGTIGGIDGLLLHQVATGYLRRVILYTGSFDEEQLRARIYGQAPCIAIHWTGDDYTPKGQLQGVLYDVNAGFQVWIASRNFRGGLEAQVAPVSLEAALDPGPMALYGLAKQLLAGTQLDLLGVKQVQILRGQPQHIDEAETQFVFALDLRVQLAEHSENADNEFAQLLEVDVQRFLVADGHDPPIYDADNQITSGLDVSSGLGLTQTVAAGAARIAGVTVSYVGAAHLFTASSRTYRDLLPNGTMVFLSTLLGASEPAVTATALRVGCTVTDATGVVADKFIATYSVAYPAAGTTDTVPVT